MLVFNIYIGTMIMLNALVMGIETDHDMGMVGLVLEHIFTATWTVEMVIRIATLKPRGYFTDPWYLLDFCLAWMSILDAWILPGGSSLKMLSVLRILRMLRMLRLVKFLKLFKELWLLVHGLVKAVSVLSWVMVLIIIVVYVAALFMTSVVGHECDVVYTSFADCDEMFGTIPKSMYTLFQVITLESWSMAVARPVLREKPALIIFFVFFLYITTFGLLNVVTGVIVDQTLQSSQENTDNVHTYYEKQREEQLPLLIELFQGVDIDGSGEVDLDEFLDTCEKDEAQSRFIKFGLQVHPREAAQRLFEALDYDANEKIKDTELVERTSHLLSDGSRPMSDQTLVLIELRCLAQRLTVFEEKIKFGDRKEGNHLKIAEAIMSAEKKMTQRIAAMETSVDDRMRRIEASILTETTL